MRVHVVPRQAEVVPGRPLRVSVTITNTSTVIGGYTIRVLGADPQWVQAPGDRVSMFPGESRTIPIVVTMPVGTPAGARRIAVQVRELTPPEATDVAEIDITVPAARAVSARLDPLAVTGGRRAQFTVLVENRGNTLVRGDLAAEDPESKVRVAFEPDRLVLSPGEHAVVDMTAHARRPFMGSPTARILSVFLDELPDEPFFGPDTPPRATHEDTKALATGTFIQRSLVSRGPLSLVGLLLAVTVFAIVITIAMSRLVGQSAADRNLALQIAAAQNSSNGTGTSGLSGTVRLLTTGSAAPGVSVAVYDASNISTVIATTATNTAGAYSFANLPAGQYKLSFRGAGFVQLWYPGSATDADATTVTLPADTTKSGLDVTIGGVPATISGTVSGTDVAAATLRLEKYIGTPASAVTTRSAALLPLPAPPGATVQATAVPGAPAAPQGSSPNPPPDDGNAVVQTVPVGADGTFTLTNVPSPSVYVLVVSKTGYATSSQQIDVGAGEERTGVDIGLRKGDGVISGTVTSPAGPLGDVTLTATTGQSTASTVSLTEGTPGTFTLRGLPTPATYTLIASKQNFASQTITVTLASGQRLTGLAITLGQSAGALGGSVSLLHPGASDTPGAGVGVTVTDGLLTVQTETNSSGAVGSWQVGGLPLPGTYTVTFARSDLAPQTVSVSLDANGNVTAGSLGATTTGSGIRVRMTASTATVRGTVRQPGGERVCDSNSDLGEATVSLNSGSTTYTVTTASVPASRCGQYVVENVPPGTYTLTVEAGSGTTPTSLGVTVGVGDDRAVDVTLARPASMTGTVLATDGKTARCGWTVFLYLAAQYPTTPAATVHMPASGTSCNSFTFNRIDAGSYIVAVGPTPDAANAVKTVSVLIQPSEQYGTTADDTFPFQIEADPGG